MSRNASKKSFDYSTLTLQAVDIAFRNCQGKAYPIQDDIVDIVAKRISEIEGAEYTKKQVQSSVSRHLSALFDNDKVVKIGKKQYAPNNLEYARTVSAEQIQAAVQFGRPDIFLASFVNGDSCTATIVIDIADTSASQAQNLFKRYLDRNGFGVVSSDQYLQLMLIGTKTEVQNLYQAIAELVRSSYNMQNPKPVKKPLTLKRKSSPSK